MGGDLGSKVGWLQMPQKIDIHGIFLDPETITDLYLQKRISVYYPVFEETGATKSFFGRFSSSQNHILRFVKHEPFGIILADAEQPDPASYIVEYREALFNRLFKGIGQAGKNIVGHVNEMLKIDISGDRQYRILQSGRQVKNISIREIPAKARLLSGQVVDVFKSTPNYDFQGGTPYSTTDLPAAALMIIAGNKVNVLFGAGVDATDDDVKNTYNQLAVIYNQIQASRDAKIEGEKNRPLFQLPQINIQLPKIELPKISEIRFQSPFVVDKKDKSEEALPIPEATEQKKDEIPSN